MKEIYIHVGLHKTGTTFLQENVFPFCDINFFKKPAIIKTELKEGVNLISDEELSIGPHRKNCIAERYVFIDNLKRLFPDAKIILCTREEQSWKESLYAQYIRYGGFLSKEDFLASIDAEYFKVDKYREYIEERFDEVLVCSFEELCADNDAYVQKICQFMGIETPEYKKSRKNVSLADRQLTLLRFLDRFFSTDRHDGLLPCSLWKLILFGLFRIFGV